METPAKQRGIVADKNYRVVGPRKGGRGTINSTSNAPVGSVVTVREDDGSDLPYFYVLKDGKELVKDTDYHAVINVVDTLLEEVAAEEPVAVEPADVHVSINPNSTTIVIQKRLSIDEVHAVLKAAGV